MKTKLIFWILVLMMGCTVFSTIQGADRFYYGVYNGDPQTEFGYIRDSLRFNIVCANNVNSQNISYWVADSLRAIVSNSNDSYSPYTWADSSL